MMDGTALMYLALAIILLLLTFGMIKHLAAGAYYYIDILLMVVAAVVMLMITKVDFLLFSAVTSLLGITFKPANNYLINKKQNAVIKTVNGIYYATGYVTANLFPYVFKNENPPENDEEKMVESLGLWENIVKSLNFPFKFHVFAIGLAVQETRDELEGKRSYQEYQMNKAMQGNANETVIANIQRNMRIIQGKIDAISKGEKPIATIMYIETTAVGISEKDALDKLTGQIESIQLSFSSFDVELRRIVGRELYDIFKFNFSLPLTVKDAGSLFDQQA